MTGRGAPAEHRANLRAAGLTVLALALFAVSDAIVKLLTAAYPPGQILFCRGALAALLMGLYFARRRSGWPRIPLSDRAAWLRSLSDFLVSWAFFHALARLPLAEATAILFVFPLILTGLGVVVLAERVPPSRWAAVALGLAGVLLILRPGAAAFSSGATWALAAAVGLALRDLATRFVGPGASTEGLALMGIAIATLASLGAGVGDWVVPDATGALGLAATAALVSVAFVLIVAGTRRGDISFTAPFRYVSVPLSFLLGYLIWGQIPDAAVLLGTSIIMTAGWLVVRRKS
ncbi:MAG: DMT family transporter [Geminicoccaceae bacterium]